MTKSMVENLDNPTTVLLWALSRNGYQPKNEVKYFTIETEPFMDEAAEKLQALLNQQLKDVLAELPEPHKMEYMPVKDMKGNLIQQLEMMSPEKRAFNQALQECKSVIKKRLGA